MVEDYCRRSKSLRQPGVWNGLEASWLCEVLAEEQQRLGQDEKGSGNGSVLRGLKC